VSERRHLTWLWIGAAVLAAAVAYATFARASDQGTSSAPRVSVAGPGARGSGQARLWVHVSGAVRRPGLYRLAQGSRVGEAVQRAGGPSRRADLAGVNLAAQLEDGQQVNVPRRGAQAPVAGGETGAADADGGAPVSLGTATAEQLDQIDGIGPTLAARILEYRNAHGGFRSVDELREVDGIGEKRFEALREAVQP